MIRSRRGTWLKARWFVEIVRWSLKLRCVTQFTQFFRPEDGPPASIHNPRELVAIICERCQDLSSLRRLEKDMIHGCT